MTHIGVISDTHGLLRDEALQALAGSEMIIHAGDVGDAKIIGTLEAIAPVVAVRGNIDKGSWAASLPPTAIAEAGDTRIYVLHDIHELNLDPAAAGLHIVIFGHSHKPLEARRSGVLYLNPGSAGPRRFKLPVTVARLKRKETTWEVEFVDLMRE